MMKLIENADAVAARHTSLEADRAREIVHHLRHVPEDDLPKVLAAWRANGMPAAELALAEELLGIRSPAKAPQAQPKKSDTETKDKK